LHTLVYCCQTPLHASVCTGHFLVSGRLNYELERQGQGRVSCTRTVAHEIQPHAQHRPFRQLLFIIQRPKKLFQIVLKVASLNETYVLCRALTFSTNHFEFPFRRHVQSETDDAKITITRQRRRRKNQRMTQVNIFINFRLTQHVSGIIMPIVRRQTV